MAELEESVTRQGGKFEDYLKHLKKSRNELMLEMMPNAIKRVKAALIIREIAMVEKISPSDEEVENKVSELKAQYAGQEKVLKMFEEPGYKSYLRNILNNEKVIEKLKEWNYADTGSKQKS
jgi:FKBP-type peptidyl-prolyl cis-trans isomerase (trigger factor)